MVNQRAGVLGTGHSYPEGILTNADLAKIVETSDEWITTRTGIKQRRKAAPDEYTSLFAVRAARQAIERARLDPADIDLLLCATVTPDQILPSTGCIVQAELGANNAAAMDIVAACSGFLYGVSLADSMIRTGQVRHAVVVGAEILTQYVDYRIARRACCLATAPAPPCSDQLIPGEAFWRRRSSLTDVTRNSFIHPAAALAGNRRQRHWPRVITSSR